MPDPTHITVTAPEGRRTPIHHRDGVDLGGDPLHVVAGRVCRVAYSQDVRRAIGRGDLVPCNMDGARVTVALAASPATMQTVAAELAEVITPARVNNLAAALAAVAPKKEG